jgi:hypothetical protein
LKRRKLSLHCDDETKRINRAGIATWVHHDDDDDDPQASGYLLTKIFDSRARRIGQIATD